MNPKDRIIVALDTSDLDDAQRLIEELHEHVGMFKFGLQMAGAMLVQGKALSDLVPQGSKVMLDLKLHDIPNTMEGGMFSLGFCSELIWGVTVHASAGKNGMRAALNPARRFGIKTIAVTVLTSHSDDECHQIYGRTAETKAHLFARDAEDVGVDAIVCSPKEVETIRRCLYEPDRVKFICPGVRPKWAFKDDQNRSTTPAQAISAGAHYLVIGRPITKYMHGPSVAEAAQRIADELS